MLSFSQGRINALQLEYQSMIMVSISGGMNDLLVESSLSDLSGIFNVPNSISVIASQIPEVNIPVEHQVIFQLCLSSLF